MKERHDQSEVFPQDDVRSAIQAGITKAQMEMGEIKPNPSKGKQKIMYAIFSVAAVLGIIIFSSFQSPAIAYSLSKIPIIGSVFGNSDIIGLQIAQENGLALEIGETKTINGISVTLNEVLYDQNNISIGLIIESEKDLEEFYFGAGMDLLIDGKYPKMTTGSYGEEIISETTRTAIQMIGVTEDMPEQFELGLILNGKNGETWYFSTPIEKIKDIKTIPVAHTQTVDGIQLIVTDMSISKTGISLNYVGEETGVEFGESRGQYMEFHIVDQDGNEISGITGGSSSEMKDGKIVHRSLKYFDPIDSDVTALTITPYLSIPSSGGGVNEYGDHFNIDYSGIKPVQFESFTVEIPK